MYRYQEKTCWQFFSCICAYIISFLQNGYNLICPSSQLWGSWGCRLLFCVVLEFAEEKKCISCYLGLWALPWPSVVHWSDCKCLFIHSPMNFLLKRVMATWKVIFKNFREAIRASKEQGQEGLCKHPIDSLEGITIHHLICVLLVVDIFSLLIFFLLIEKH